MGIGNWRREIVYWRGATKGLNRCVKGIKYIDRGMETLHGAGVLFTVTSLYLFTDRRVQRWVRCSSSAQWWEWCSGAKAFPDSRSLLTYFPQWLVLQGENCRSTGLKGTPPAHCVNTEADQEKLINNIHSVRCLLRMYARYQMHELFWNTGCLQMVSWSPLDSVLFGCCHGARNIFVPQKCLFFDSFLSGSRFFL